MTADFSSDARANPRATPGQPARARQRRGWVLPATAGGASVAFGAGLGELAAALLAPGAGPFVAIGGFMIDVAPPWAKDLAIAIFGTGDKVALLIGIGIVLAALAGAAGVLEFRRPPWGRVLFAAAGVFAAVAAFTRTNAPTLAIVPALVAAGAAMLVLPILLRRIPPPESSRIHGASQAVDRRRFLIWAGTTTAAGVLSAVAASAAQATTRAVTSVRDALKLPAARASATVPKGAELGIDGLAPVVTPNAQFYRIDTALRVPNIDPADWNLRIHGLVENEVTITWNELIAMPLDESITTLACVSNEVGGELIGNAVWLGIPIRDLLARAAPTADADMVLSHSHDGFTAGTPIQALQDDRNAILAIGMNGHPLPLEHGFPVRMVVPGLYGYVSATKWLTELEVTRFDTHSAYWTDRGWAPRGPIKLSSRIDVPRQGARVSSGTAAVAGVAWHQHTGIAAVDVQVDDGEWQPARLATAINDDTWVQWVYEWPATSGQHTLRVRATDAAGEVQTSKRAPVVPDGASGLHEITVDVA